MSTVESPQNCLTTEQREGFGKQEKLTWKVFHPSPWNWTGGVKERVFVCLFACLLVCFELVMAWVRFFLFCVGVLLFVCSTKGVLHLDCSYYPKLFWLDLKMLSLADVLGRTSEQLNWISFSWLLSEISRIIHIGFFNFLLSWIWTTVLPEMDADKNVFKWWDLE